MDMDYQELELQELELQELERQEMVKRAVELHKRSIDLDGSLWMEGEVEDYRLDESGTLSIRYESGNWWSYKDLDLPFPTWTKGINSKYRLFVDMDGTMAEFKQVDTLEKLYEKGYFMNLNPHMNVVEAVRKLAQENNEIEVYIMSSVLSDSEYALEEKNAWLDKYIPEIDNEHRIFPVCGKNKLQYIPGPDNPGKKDFLLDDYTQNLTMWEPPCTGIKLLNGINHTHGTWKGRKVEYSKEPEQLAENIKEHMKDVMSKKLLRQSLQQRR